MKIKESCFNKTFSFVVSNLELPKIFIKAKIFCIFRVSSSVVDGYPILFWYQLSLYEKIKSFSSLQKDKAQRFLIGKYNLYGKDFLFLYCQSVHP